MAWLIALSLIPELSKRQCLLGTARMKLVDLLTLRERAGIMRALNSGIKVMKGPKTVSRMVGINHPASWFASSNHTNPYENSFGVSNQVDLFELTPNIVTSPMIVSLLYIQKMGQKHVKCPSHSFCNAVKDCREYSQ